MNENKNVYQSGVYKCIELELVHVGYGQKDGHTTQGNQL